MTGSALYRFIHLNIISAIATLSAESQNIFKFDLSFRDSVRFGLSLWDKYLLLLSKEKATG
jgi:hypothetical protein